MRLSRAEYAARNNAAWCDAVCRAHGSAGEWLDGCWINRSPSPPFYPNIVTLRDSADPAPVLANVRDLSSLGWPQRWGVKDSFCRLDLASEGFESIFTASWIWREPPRAETPPIATGLGWSEISTEAALADWERAWALAAGSPQETRLFPPALLADRRLTFLAGARDGHIIAGGVASHTEEVVGLSNVFAPIGEEPAVWSNLNQCAQLKFPGLPLVGYQQGRTLDITRTCGFEVVGSLRVWLRAVDAS